MNTTFTNTQIDLDSLPDYQEIHYTGVSVKRLYKVLCIQLIFFIAVTVGLFFLREVTDVPYLIPGLGAGIILFVLSAAGYQYKLQQTLGYAIRERDIAYRRGFIFEKTTVIPFNRIQHISTSASALDRIFKISNLNIFTAGGSGSDIDIPGLTPELAARLKDKVANHIIDEDDA
ncbi:PH domain-containing protein [Leeuwenhoekiella sp. H156]|uniref:PH domain-containing protein n=1 Tax=Leeuwenhoekiella sp. H156 TaxID=3450128 RepID=UPI003FA44A0D